MDDQNDEYTFSWTGPNSFTSTMEDIDDLMIGCYELYVVNIETGCSLDTIICVDDLTDVLSTEHQSIVQLYPNPVNDLLFIEFNDFIQEYLEIEFISITGRAFAKVKKQQGEKIVVFQTGEFPAGYYTLRIKGYGPRQTLMLRMIRL
jgi:hypothetical protein